MNKNTFRKKVEEELSKADIRINGDRQTDISVHNDSFYPRVLEQGSLGLGESYMEGWWDCRSLDEFMYRVLRTRLDERVRTLRSVGYWLQAKIFNLQKGNGAYRIGKRHYDIGNDLFQCMLDRRMIYSCACWQNADTLEEAQEAKLELICRKLKPETGMKVLDIGCGWGGTALFIADSCGVEVTGITVSKEQADYGSRTCQGKPVKIEFKDYREIGGKFDRIVSVGMFEHVGYKNHRTFFETVRKLLDRDGIFVLQTIGGNRSRNRTDPWIDKYIFPDSNLPSPKMIATAAEGVFVVEDWQNLGADYDRTLMQWFRNFKENWPSLKQKYGERFYRMWTYYLLTCAGAFRARRNQLWQIVMSPRGVEGGYRFSR